MNQPASNAVPADRLTRFSDRVGDYVKHRPSYPERALDVVLEGRDPAQVRVIDVGAGTGISSRLLAARGCHVVALEPNADMRAAGASQSNSRIEWAAGTGEATGRATGEFDLVTCFQAFHWLDDHAALAEFRRVLKPDGRAALVWNVRDDSDAFTRAYTDVILRHATDPPRSPHLGGGGHVPDAFREGWSGYRMESVPNEQAMDLPGVLGRALSASYCPNAGPALDAMRADLEREFHRHARDDRVTLRYLCQVHVAGAPSGG